MLSGTEITPGIKGFSVSVHENFCTGRTSTPRIGCIRKVVLMQTRHSHFHGYVIKVIVSGLQLSHPRCQWLCAKTALRLGLESFLAACLDLEAIGVYLTALVYKLPIGSLTPAPSGCGQLFGYCALQLCIWVSSCCWWGMILPPELSNC